jgi:pimeloyl-ACP methyl ester carboxylesterase
MMIKSFDGAQIHVTRMGKGRALLCIHGFVSSAQVNWIDYGTAALLAASDFDLYLPDLRGHGLSDVHVPYPADVLRDDILALLDHYHITDYDLVGYSLGARIAVRVALGRPPRRLVVSGMGLSGIIDMQNRQDWFIAAIEHRASPRDAAEARVASFLKTMKMDAEAAIAVLQSQVATSQAELAQLTMPTLVLCGVDDQDNGSAADLAAALPNATYVEIPGTHMSAITRPEFGAAIRDFLVEK